MPELLLEVGCEELPATVIERAYQDLLARVEESLVVAGLTPGEGRAHGTPRRLIISFSEVPDRQADATKEQRGPALKSAYGVDGEPTPALLGFCRAQGVSVNDLRPDEQYVWATKFIPGRSTVGLLAELLPKAIRALTFEKTMRWGASRMRFARPIRWILATFSGEVVPFDVEGVTSGLESRGHRFYAPEPFPARTFDELIAGLRERKVEPDAAVRRATIERQVREVSGDHPENRDLVEENTFLTEWPTAIEGRFRAEYQTLPDAVLGTAMMKHEKMFPVTGPDGKLTNRFIFIRNSGEDDTVRSGCEWVLNARFNDAKFFFNEDAKSSMDGFLEKTATIVFQEKLGTVRQRASRLEGLATAVATATGGTPEEIAFAGQAGRYAKADLSSGLVGELTSLQGVIGGEYAAREGFPPAVQSAIRGQYNPPEPRGPGDDAERTTVRLQIADQLDKLAGYLGLGLEPSGSSDPYALRRAATVLIESAWRWEAELPSYDVLFRTALAQYRDQGVALDEAGALAALVRIFESRYAALSPDIRHDILQAALIEPGRPESTDPKSVRFRIELVTRLAQDAAFVQTATRPINIVLAARKKGIVFETRHPNATIEAAALESAEAVELLSALAAHSEPLALAEKRRDGDGVVPLLASLAAPINRFFDRTMVMVDEVSVRSARLSLLQACVDQFLVAGDFSKIVIEGD